jgi:hypothetical protein
VSLLFVQFYFSLRVCLGIGWTRGPSSPPRHSFPSYFPLLPQLTRPQDVYGRVRGVRAAKIGYGYMYRVVDEVVGRKSISMLLLSNYPGLRK